MDALGIARKRGRMADAAANGTTKRSRELDFQPGLGSKSKPCTKFFSTSGCPFGEACHFLHYVPGGLNAVAQMTNLGNNPLAAAAASSPAVKTRICTKYAAAEGCKFGDKCHFAHGELELGKPIYDSRRFEPPPPAPAVAAAAAAAASFGASATAKISVDASLAGAIIGKGGVNTKQICRATGAKLSIRDHETDANLRNIELEGSFDQIKQASAMVRELIVSFRSSAPLPAANPATFAAPAPAASSNFKTKLCEKFAKGSCTFGERCHFAHGAAELRRPGV